MSQAILGGCRRGAITATTLPETEDVQEVERAWASSMAPHGNNRSVAHTVYSVVTLSPLLPILLYLLPRTTILWHYHLPFPRSYTFYLVLLHYGCTITSPSPYYFTLYLVLLHYGMYSSPPPPHTITPSTLYYYTMVCTITSPSHTIIPSTLYYYTMV